MKLAKVLGDRNLGIWRTKLTVIICNVKYEAHLNCTATRAGENANEPLIKAPWLEFQFQFDVPN